MRYRLRNTLKVVGVLLGSASVFVVGCSDMSVEATEQTLAKNPWQVEWFGALEEPTPLVEGTAIQLGVKAGKISGTASCYTYAGRYELSDGKKIKTSDVTLTKNGDCEDPHNQIEAVRDILANAAIVSTLGGGDSILLRVGEAGIRLTQN